MRSESKYVYRTKCIGRTILEICQKYVEPSSCPIPNYVRPNRPPVNQTTKTMRKQNGASNSVEWQEPRCWQSSQRPSAKPEPPVPSFFFIITVLFLWYLSFENTVSYVQTLGNQPIFCIELINSAGVDPSLCDRPTLFCYQ